MGLLFSFISDAIFLVMVIYFSPRVWSSKIVGLKCNLATSIRYKTAQNCSQPGAFKSIGTTISIVL